MKTEVLAAVAEVQDAAQSEIDHLQDVREAGIEGDLAAGLETDTEIADQGAGLEIDTEIDHQDGLEAGTGADEADQEALGIERAGAKALGTGIETEEVEARGIGEEAGVQVHETEEVHERGREVLHQTRGERDHQVHLLLPQIPLRAVQYLKPLSIL